MPISMNAFVLQKKTGAKRKATIPELNHLTQYYRFIKQGKALKIPADLSLYQLSFIPC